MLNLSFSFNIFLGLVLFFLIIFYQKKLKKTEEDRQEMESVLAIRIKARTRELRDLADSLDIQVKERTLALQEKINESEKFNRLTVGRELRMIELKKEINALKEEIRKTNNKK